MVGGGLEGRACIREGGNDRNVGNYIMRNFVICAVLSVFGSVMK